MSDLIDRENAKDKFCEHCDIRVLARIDVDVCREKSGCIFMRQLDKVKTVEAEPVRHGRWEYDKKDCRAVCSNCHCHGGPYLFDKQSFKEYTEEQKYCPYCGAKMDGEEQNDV